MSIQPISKSALWQICHNLYLGLTTYYLAYYLAKTGTNSFDCYNIRQWILKRSFFTSKKKQDGFAIPSTNLSSRNPQVKTGKRLRQPWPSRNTGHESREHASSATGNANSAPYSSSTLPPSDRDKNSFACWGPSRPPA